MHVPRAMPNFRRSYALLTTSECKQIAVFVHGFFGKSTSTWRNFQGLVDDAEFAGQWAATDLFFYKYDSRRPIGISAQDFSSFLGAVLKGDLEDIAPTDFLPPTFITQSPPSVWKKRSYQSLLLVAHSEGGVVIRRALLDTLADIERQAQSEIGEDGSESKLGDLVKERAKSKLRLNSKLRLFAPACLGINFSSMFGFALSYSDILYAIAASFPARNDLADDSPIIIQIKDETEEAARHYPSLSGLRAHILFGEKDHIVHFGGYKHDLVMPYEKRQSHTGICKPKPSYRRPLGFAQ